MKWLRPGRSYNTADYSTPLHPIIILLHREKEMAVILGTVGLESGVKGGRDLKWKG